MNNPFDNETAPDTPDAMHVVANGIKYELSDEFLKRIENLARSMYSGNDFFSCYWTTESDEPVLCIETSGQMVPWEQLTEFELSMEDFDNDSKTDIDNGNGVKMVDPSDIDSDDDVDDFKMVVTPRNFQELPDPEDERFSTWPAQPEEYDEEDGPKLNMPVPENKRAERWATGTALVPMETSTRWNIQRRIDTSFRFEGEPKQDSHDEWEMVLQETDCEPVARLSPQNPPKQEDDSDEYDPYKDNEDIGGKFGGTNFHV